MQDGAEHRRQPGRPRGSRDTKPRVKKCRQHAMIVVDEAEPCSDQRGCGMQRMTYLNSDDSLPAWNDSIFSQPSICHHKQAAITMYDAELRCAGQQSVEDEIEAAWSESTPVSINSADPFHGDWPYW